MFRFSTQLIAKRQIGHHKAIRVLTFRELALRQSESQLNLGLTTEA